MVPLVAAALLLTGAVRPDQRTGVSIELERTACFGTCPVYTVTIHGDGRVVYKGSRFVRVEGTERKTIDPRDVESLVQEFQRAGFFEMKDEYTALVTDQPTTILKLSLDGRTKRITDYYDAPEALRTLEARVDEVAGTKRWVYVDAETIRDLRAGGKRLSKNEEQKQLVLAARRRDIEVVRALLAAGADANGKVDGMPPLFAARTSETVAALVGAGAQIDVKTASGVPLIVWMAGRDAGMLEPLLKAGARVNERSENGTTPLMAAASGVSPATVELLLKAGADPALVNKSGDTALSLAETRLRQDEELARKGGPPRPFDLGPHVEERRQIVDLLRQATAKR